MENKRNTVIQFKNITKKFGNFTAVSNVNLDIREGEIVGFLGPNGAGKSTTMKMMAFLLRPTEGEVYIRSSNHGGSGKLEKLKPENKDYLLDNIGFLIENPAFYNNVTPREILTYFGELKGYPRSALGARVEEVVEMVHMSDWIDKKIGTFSKGMRQKIGVVAAIVHDPAIVVLDEPHTGLDPQARRELRDFILALKKQEKTIFLSSHLLYEVSEVADRIAIISHGRIIACDSLGNLEAMAKKSIIKLELLNMDDNIDARLKEIEAIVKPLSGVADIEEKDKVTFNKDTKTIDILFNGMPENQFAMLKALVTNQVEIIEFSVPKAGLLEDIYLNLINEPENPAKGEPNKEQIEGTFENQSGGAK
ncbi:MAG: ABC transporter ATP-binding protein [Promethearchaeota archaeon]